MEDKIAIIDADFFNKLVKYTNDTKVFVSLMNTLHVNPIVHIYVYNNEIWGNEKKELDKLIVSGFVKIVNHNEYILDDDSKKDFIDFFKDAYYRMSGNNFPDDTDIFTYKEPKEHLGEIWSSHYAKKNNCFYFMSDDSDARNFINSYISSKKNPIIAVSIYDVFVECRNIGTELTIRDVSYILRKVFYNREEKRDYLIKLYE